MIKAKRKGAVVHLSMPVEVKDKLEALAAKESRTKSNYVVKIINEIDYQTR